MEKIKTATYRLQSEAWEPGDTIPGYSVYTFVEEYDNPADTAVGASYADYSDAEKKQISSCYDGDVRLSFYHDKHGVMVDDFTRRNLPFRLTFGNLQYRAEAFYKIEAGHGNRHTSFRQEMRRITSTTEIIPIGR